MIYRCYFEAIISAICNYQYKIFSLSQISGPNLRKVDNADNDSRSAKTYKINMEIIASQHFVCSCI